VGGGVRSVGLSAGSADHDGLDLAYACDVF
jgi:hypothetical protein